MVAFWKDVASKVSELSHIHGHTFDTFLKAPHHSRASWMKFWRRHKHELDRTESDDPLPQAPDKKMRYSVSDDVLLAKYFHTKPEGTSDKIFQAFGRMVSHLLISSQRLLIDANIASPSPLERMARTPQDPQEKN